MRRPVNPIGRLRRDRPAELAETGAGRAEPDPAEVLASIEAGLVRQVIGLALPALGRPGGSRVVLLAGGHVDALRAGLEIAEPQAAVRVVEPADAGAMHTELAATGHHDVIIDATGDATQVRADRARVILMHLRKGGILVVADAGALGPDVDDDGLPVRPFVRLVGDALRVSLDPPADDRRRNRVRSYAAGWGKAVETVTSRNGHLAITNGLAALAKVREEQVGTYLAIRGAAAGEVLLERPATVVENPIEIKVSAADDAVTYATRFESPPLQLRSYRRPACWPGQVVTQRGVLLPDTYRHLARPKNGNRFVDDIAPDFGRMSRDKPTELLPGAFFHLDSEYRGHFGHALTEQIARLWAWQDAKRAEPDLRALLMTNRKRTTVAEWEYQLYEAAGVSRSDVVFLDRPVRVERLLAATPMFSQPEYVHAGIVDVYRTIGDNLAAQAPDRDYPARIFCSRRLAKRSCHNTPEVEAFFADRGFEIVYPEDYPLGEQVQLFRRAEAIAGFGGSAMFTMAFVTEPTRVFLVSSENYRAQNEALMAAVHGHELNVAWCRPDKTRAAGFKGSEAMHSEYTFDVEREGRFLSELLD
jgi:capsular polysaccharide biosynthesis protein